MIVTVTEDSRCESFGSKLFLSCALGRKRREGEEGSEDRKGMTVIEGHSNASASNSAAQERPMRLAQAFTSHPLRLCGCC